MKRSNFIKSILIASASPKILSSLNIKDMQISDKSTFTLQSIIKAQSKIKDYVNNKYNKKAPN